MVILIFKVSFQIVTCLLLNFPDFNNIALEYNNNVTFFKPDQTENNRFFLKLQPSCHDA